MDCIFSIGIVTVKGLPVRLPWVLLVPLNEPPWAWRREWFGDTKQLVEMLERTLGTFCGGLCELRTPRERFRLSVALAMMSRREGRWEFWCISSKTCLPLLALAGATTRTSVPILSRLEYLPRIRHVVRWQRNLTKIIPAPICNQPHALTKVWRHTLRAFATR